jgi:hypothetical protein
VGVEVMAEKTAWKAARVGSGEAAKVVGSARRGWRRGVRERAGRLYTNLYSMRHDCVQTTFSYFGTR